MVEKSNLEGIDVYESTQYLVNNGVKAAIEKYDISRESLRYLADKARKKERNRVMQKHRLSREDYDMLLCIKFYAPADKLRLKVYLSYFKYLSIQVDKLLDIVDVTIYSKVPVIPLTFKTLLLKGLEQSDSKSLEMEQYLSISGEALREWRYQLAYH